MVNALEKHRKIHHTDPLYAACPESQLGLRTHHAVTTVIDACKRDEAGRQEKSQDMKANGTDSRTFGCNIGL